MNMPLKAQIISGHAYQSRSDEINQFILVKTRLEILIWGYWWLYQVAKYKKCLDEVKINLYLAISLIQYNSPEFIELENRVKDAKSKNRPTSPLIQNTNTDKGKYAYGSKVPGISKIILMNVAGHRQK